MLDSPAAERGGAAGSVDERDHDAQQNEEHEYTCVPAVRDGADEAVVEHGVERVNGVEAADEKRADNNADKQRRISLLGDKGQNNGHNGRHECPESTVHQFFPPKKIKS